MENVKLDPELGARLADFLPSLLNVHIIGSINEAYVIIQKMGGDNPLTAGLLQKMNALAALYNNEVTPAANTFFDAVAGYCDLATYVKKSEVDGSLVPVSAGKIEDGESLRSAAKKV